MSQDAQRQNNGSYIMDTRGRCLSDQEQTDMCPTISIRMNGCLPSSISVSQGTSDEGHPCTQSDNVHSMLVFFVRIGCPTLPGHRFPMNLQSLATSSKSFISIIPPTPHPRLPYDVITLILDHFVPSSGTRKSMAEVTRFASLAFVSRDWADFIRPRLYGDILLADDASAIASRRLCSAMRDLPSLAKLVRTCTLVGPNGWDSEGLGIADAEIFHHALQRMDNLSIFSIRQVDMSLDLIHTFSQLQHLDTLSIIGCTFAVPPQSQSSISFNFALRHLVIHGSPSLGHDALISKFFKSERMESISIDSQVTRIGLHTLASSPSPRLQRMYAEPSRENGALFSKTLLLHPTLQRVGFSHGLRSLPLDPNDFQSLRESSFPAGLTHWTGPSAVIESFFGNGPCHVEHVILDQLVVLDDGDVTETELLRPRNLVSSPEVEAARILAIQSLVSQWRSLRSLDVVLSSSNSLKDIIAKCQPGLTKLHIQCTETLGHDDGLMDAAVPLSRLVGLREIQITSPPGYTEPEIERDLQRQHEVVQKWASTCSAERIGFSAWLRWHRASKGEWTPLVTSPDLASKKTAQWRRRRFSIKDWEGHLLGTLGEEAVCDSRTDPPVASSGPESFVVRMSN